MMPAKKTARLQSDGCFAEEVFIVREQYAAKRAGTVQEVGVMQFR
jgi:hypothetical protein